jgi:SAM-dependent methyltransferase
MRDKNLLITTSWDDGGMFDDKLLTLLTKYNMAATFFRNEPVVKPFEQGGHTKSHPDLTKLSDASIKSEIKNLPAQAGQKSLVPFAYPKGKYNQEVKQLVGQAGYKYARTTALFETRVGDLLEAGTTIHAYNHHLLVYLLHGWNKILFWKLIFSGADFSDWEDLAKKSLDILLNSGGIYHLWGHSWEIENNNDWSKLERVFGYVNKKTSLKIRINNSKILELFKEQKEKYYRQNIYSKTDKKTDNMLYNISIKYNKKSVNVLELGCGDGRYSKYFDKANYIGIDYNLPRSLIKDLRFKSFDISKLDALKLPKQDLIIALGLLEDETDILGFIDRLKPLTGKKTLIIITVHNADSLSFRFKEYIKRQLGLRPFAFSSYTKKFLKTHISPIGSASSKDVIDLGEYLVVLSKDEN